MYYGKDTRISMRTTLVTSGLLLIINCNGESTLDFQTSVQGQPVLCPPCDHIFTRLEVDRRGHRVQDIELHERGEPKSGTGFMMDWAGESVIRACEYLKQLYGEETCSVRTRQDPLLSECFLTFDPTKADDDAPCTCEGIERVSINVSAHGKHVLPVDSNCRFRHSRGMATSHTPCSFKDKSVPNSYEDMVRCIDEADCTFVDTHDQMAIFRDPRPVAVSSYFYLKVHGRIGPWEHATVDDFVLETFPIICQWVALRHILFEGILKRRTISFWYNDALADPTLWHRQLVGFLGLNLPEAVVEAASKATAEHRLSFKTKAIDKHPGGENATVSRSYVDEIKEETLIRLNEMLVLWMPPLIGHRLNKSTFS